MYCIEQNTMGRKSKNSHKSPDQIQAEKRAAAAEYQRKHQAKRSQEKKARDDAKAKARLQMRKYRAKRSQEEKARDNAKASLEMRKYRAKLDSSCNEICKVWK